MFTGLIQSIGTIHLGVKGLEVKGCEAFSPLSAGDSVAVDGVCLTVSDCIEGGFIADISPETLSRTTLADKSKRENFVNLEPALRLSDRLGGHIVSGHVDGLGKVISIDVLGNSYRLEMSWQQADFGKYICEKGSIAVDGISLTVGGCSNKGSSFWVAVIPHTWERTSLQYLSIGSLVNLEADLMAKYAESLLGNGNIQAFSPEISKDWLTSHGWS